MQLEDVHEVLANIIRGRLFKQDEHRLLVDADQVLEPVDLFFQRRPIIQVWGPFPLKCTQSVQSAQCISGVEERLQIHIGVRRKASQCFLLPAHPVWIEKNDRGNISLPRI